ncbi:hypothetical protein ACFUTV_40160 [Streptomyces sp. NPDC057298]|uniref:hypothetical protein n=1 Tax=Streptomyces sp. NPDC057298 TaxID=3346091 RepID=UPI00363B07E4
MISALFLSGKDALTVQDGARALLAESPKANVRTILTGPDLTSRLTKTGAEVNGRTVSLDHKPGYAHAVLLHLWQQCAGRVQLGCRWWRESREDTPELYREGYDYYGAPHGQHPNGPGKYVFTSLDNQMGFDAFAHVESISPRLLLMIAGSKADTRYFSDEAVAQAPWPKQSWSNPSAVI